jgi:hypothetical protein
MAAAQSLALAMHANPVAPPQLPIITYRRDDPGHPGDYIRLDVASNAVHQWDFGAGDLVRYRERRSTLSSSMQAAAKS